MPNEQFTADIAARLDGFDTVLQKLQQLPVVLESIGTAIQSLQSSGDIVMPTISPSEIARAKEYAAILKQTDALAKLQGIRAANVENPTSSKVEQDLRNLEERRAQEAVARSTAALGTAQQQVQRASRQQFVLTPEQVAAAKAPFQREADTSSVGRAISKLADLETKRAVLAAEAASLDKAAMSEETATRDAGAKIAALAQRRLTLEQQIAQQLELVRTGVRSQVASSQAAASAFMQQTATSRGIGQFMLGFRGASDLPYLQQAGQAAKFSVLYGTAYKALFGLTQALHEALTQGIEFQQGMSDLALATGRPKDQLDSLAEELARQAAAAGQSPSKGVEIGARAIGLYDASGQPLDVQRQVALSVNDVVQKIAAADKAAGSEVDINKLATTVAAVTKALGTGYQGAGMVADLDAYFSKHFGIAQGATLEGAQTASSVGVASGFSPQQIMAFIAYLMNATGQSSATVGGYLAQIFSRGGEGALKKIDQTYGINDRLSIAQQFPLLSQVFRSGNQQVQQQILAAGGRGKVQNAFALLMENLPEVNQQVVNANRGGDQGATGALNRAFDQHMGNIGGQLAVLGGDFKEFAHLIGESGMLSGLGLLVHTTDDLVKSLNTLLGLYVQMPAAIRDLLGVLAAVSIAGKVGLIGTTASEGAGLLASLRGATIGGAALLPRAGAAIGSEAPAAFLGRYTAAMGGEAGAAAAGEGMSKIGAVGATMGAWPLLAAGAGVIALGSVVSGVQKLNEAIDSASSALATSPAYGASAAAFDAQAADDRSKAKSLRVPWYMPWMRGSIDQQRKQLDDAATFYESIANQQRRNGTTSGVGKNVFGNFSDQDITTALTSMTTDGRSAAQQLNALSNAIDGLGKHASANASKINVNELSGTLSSALDRASGFKVGESRGGMNLATTSGLGVVSGIDISQYQKQIADALPVAAVASRLSSAMNDLGIKSFKQITPKVAQELSRSVVQINPKDLGSASGMAPQIQAALQKVFVKRLLDEAKSVISNLSGVTSLTPAQATATANHILQLGESASSILPQVDATGRIAQAQKTLQKLKLVESKSSKKNVQAVLIAIDQAETDLVNAQVAKFQAEYSVATQGGKKITAAGNAIAREEIRTLVKAGNPGADALLSALESLGPWAKQYARTYAADVDATAQAANQAGKGMLTTAQIIENARTVADNAAIAVSNALGSILGQTPKALGAMNVKTKNPGVADATNNAINQAINSATPVAPKNTAGQVAAARAAAFAARNGGEIAQARAAITSARADMAAATKGTVEYYNALQSYFQARQQLSQAFIDFHNSRYLLNHDDTNPIVQAQAALRKAQEQLRDDRRRGAGKDVIAADQLASRQAKESKQDTIFNQRLQDIQTQEQLGQITEAAYIRYLKSEHNRLEAVKKRTYQQQQELNQVDSLLQNAANEMNGQWNFGNIKLPTPYQVRRYIAEESAAAQGKSSAAGNVMAPSVSQTTTIYINGADTGKVKKMINDVVGKNARVLTTGRTR